MPLTSLIYKNTYDNEIKNPDNKEMIFSFDSIISENHSSTSTITTREVETVKGQFSNTINDHAIIDPKVVTMTGMISETPITLASVAVGGALGLLTGRNTNFGVNLAAGVLGGLALGSLQKTGTRTSNAYEVLTGMQQSKVVVDIVTGLKSYKSMMIQSISVDKNADLGKDAQYTCTFTEVRIVQSSIVEIDPALLKEDVSGKAQETKNEGKKSAAIAGAKTTSNASIAKQLFGS